MIGDMYMYPGKYKKDDAHERFVTLLFTCKAHFTSGNSEYDSKKNLIIRVKRLGVDIYNCWWCRLVRKCNKTKH